MSSTVETAIDIRPFHVDIPDAALEDIRRRIAATNWPEKETVTSTKSTEAATSPSGSSRSSSPRRSAQRSGPLARR
jgi:hypothetical protein